MKRYRINLQGESLERVEQSVERELEDLFAQNKLQVLTLPTILTFSLGGITIGFLEEIGKAILDKLRERFFTGDLELKTPKFEFEFEYQGTNIIAEIESKEKSELKEAFLSLENLMENISDLIEDWEHVKELKLALNLDQGNWEKVEKIK